MKKYILSLLLLGSFSSQLFARDILSSYKFDKRAPQNLILAIMQDDTKKIQKYLEHSRDLNYQHEGDVRVYFVNPLGVIKKDTRYLNGWSPLIAAIYKGNFSLVVELLKRKVEINLVTTASRDSVSAFYPEGSSAMHAASSMGAYSALVGMHKLGGDLFLKNKRGETPFHRYGMNKEIDASELAKTFEYFVEQYNESQLSEMITSGDVPLAFSKLFPNAVYTSNVLFRMIEDINWCSVNPVDARIDLLEKNINKFSLDAQNDQGLTALHVSLDQLACSGPVVKLLLKSGANPCLKDINGNTALGLIQYKYSLNADYARLYGESEKMIRDSMLDAGCM